MEKINKYFKDIKESKVVKNFIGTLRPTFIEAKSKGVLKITALALSVSLLTIPFRFGIKILKELFGGFLSLGFDTGISSITMITSLISTFRYADGGEIIQIVVFTIVSLVISLVSILLTAFFLPNGALNSFRVYVEEERIVSVKEFIQLTKLNIKRYAIAYILGVKLPLWIVSTLGTMINVIPYVSGISMAAMITSILKYILLFNMYAKLLDLNGEEEVYKNANRWFTYAIFMYILRRVTSSGIIIGAFDTIYILFVLRSILNGLENTNSYEDNMKINDEEAMNKEVKGGSYENTNSFMFSTETVSNNLENDFIFNSETNTKNIESDLIFATDTNTRKVEDSLMFSHKTASKNIEDDSIFNIETNANKVENNFMFNNSTEVKKPVDNFNYDFNVNYNEIKSDMNTDFNFDVTMSDFNLDDNI